MEQQIKLKTNCYISTAAGLQSSSSMIPPLPPPIQNEAAGGGGSLPPVSQTETPPTKSSSKQKSKRTRTAYTQAQQDQLEMAYHANPYPDGIYRQKVSDLTGIPPDRIQVCAYTNYIYLWRTTKLKTLTPPLCCVGS